MKATPRLEKPVWTKPALERIPESDERIQKILAANGFGLIRPRKAGAIR